MKNVRRNTAEKELRMAQGYIKTKEDYEAAGAVYIGSLGAAFKVGYYTIAGCDRMRQPVTEAELAGIKHFAMFADCYADQCIVTPDGKKRRPCLPVFYRG